LWRLKNCTCINSVTIVPTILGYYQINVQKTSLISYSLVGNWNRILYLPGTGNIIGDSRDRKVREGGGGGSGTAVSCSVLYTTLQLGRLLSLSLAKTVTESTSALLPEDFMKV
jgi:hypothetical protein